MKIHKIQQTKNGQFFITIPKQVVEALKWRKADTITFEITGKDQFKVMRVK